MPVKYRIATTEDAAALRDIYRPYVEHTAITFEYHVPSVEAFAQRISHTLQRYPYIVVESEQHHLLGYAYLDSYYGRDAYNWVCETSIYLAPQAQGQGIGKQLYNLLEQFAQAQHFHKIYACVAFPSVPDQYLTMNSMAFHQHIGFHQIGEFLNCGYKFNQWYHTAYLEKVIPPMFMPTHTASIPTPICWFPDLEEATCHRILQSAPSTLN